jgi:predicted porin
VGPFRFAPALEAVGPLRVQLFGTIEEEFTDNVNQTKENKESEFRTRLAPGITARLDRPNTSGLLLYAPQIFLRDLDDVSVNHALTLRGRWRPTPFIELSGGDELISSEDFRDQDDPGSRSRGTSSFLENQASVEAAYAPPNLRAGLSYTHRLALSDDETDDDSQTHTIRPNLFYQAPRWSVTAGYAASRGEQSLSSDYWEHTGDARYTRQLSPTLAGIVTGLLTFHDADQETATDFTITRARIGGNWVLAPEQVLEALIGADLFDPDPGSTKVRPSALLSYGQRFPWFRLAAAYQAGFQERFQEVDNAGVSFTQEASVILTTTTFRALTGTVALRWAYNDFQLTTPGVAQGVTEQTWDLELGLRYQIARPLFAHAGYVLTLRTSDDPVDPNAEFTENRVRIGLTYTHDLL